ncbi:unnamed protein product [Polarella glacialis]|uniref:Protein YIF1 n=1 Tax=Polarella glacialis TaxID=89957 RepID=A0A813GXB5_POLGL|nr:unnamed protein product [Polarella glacialis]
MYIPTMGFITYVVLCGLVRGLKDNFNSDVLSSIITFALVCLVIETVVVKAALFTAGAVNTPTVDLMSLLGYKFFYLSLHIIFGLLLGRGRKPTGFIFTMLALALAVCCGFALWQALRRLARMQPSHGQECMTDMHSITIKALPVFQALVCWVLLPTWPAADLVPVLTVLKATVTKAATVLVTTAAAAAANSSVPGAA